MYRSSLQYEVARLAPTEDFRHRFEEVMGDLRTMVAEFDSSLGVETKRRATSEQHKQSWHSKNESEIVPREQMINELQKQIDAQRQRKLLLQNEIARIDSQIQVAVRDQDRVQNEVNEWRSEIETRVTRIAEEDQTMEERLQHQARDLASAKELQTVLQQFCERLSTESQSKVDQFTNAQSKQTNAYFDALSVLLERYASFCQFYDHRVSELRDILQKTEQQQQRAIGLGLPAAAATASLEPIRLSIKQGRQLVSDAACEVEALMTTTKRLVNAHDPAFIGFVKGLPQKVFDVLPLGDVRDVARDLRSNGIVPAAAPAATTEPALDPAAAAPIGTHVAPVAVEAPQPAPAVSPLITSPTRSISRGSEYLASAPNPGSAHAQCDWSSQPSSRVPSNQKPVNSAHGPPNPRSRAPRSSRSSRGRNSTHQPSVAGRPLPAVQKPVATSRNGVPDRRVGGAVSNGHKTSIAPIGSSRPLNAWGTPSLHHRA